MAENNDLTPAEAQSFRAEMAEKEWGDDAGEAVVLPEMENKPVDTEEEIVEQEHQDPPAEVETIDPALRLILDGMSSKLDNITAIENRLKQAESRIGSVTNAVHNQTKQAEAAAKKVADAPSEEELKAASKSDEEWDLLKSEYPEHAELIDGLEKRFASKGAIPKIPEIPDLTDLRKAVDTDIDERLNLSQSEVDKKVEKRLVDVMRPGWRSDIYSADGTVNPEFNSWFAAQDAEGQRKANSDNAEDAIATYDSFVASKKKAAPQKTPEQIQAERDARLSRSVTVPGGGKPTKTKSVDDMTDDEYRAHLVKGGV